MPYDELPTNSTKNNAKNSDQKASQKIGLIFNWEDWLPYMEDTNIPETQKREMIETLWQIVVAFVDLGFELNPTQQVGQLAHDKDGQQNCGQKLDLKALLEQAVLKSDAVQCANPRKNKNKRKEPTP